MGTATPWPNSIITQRSPSFGTGPGMCGLTPCPKSSPPTPFRAAVSITAILHPLLPGFPAPESSYIGMWARRPSGDAPGRFAAEFKKPLES